MPEKVDLAFAILDIVGDFERVLANVQGDIGEFRQDRAPVTITDGNVYPSDDFVLAQPDIAQIAAFITRGEWSCP
jgi:hypothetical protein